MVHCDQGEKVRKVTISCTNKTESGACHYVTREATKGGNSNENRHDGGEVTEHGIGESDSDSIATKHGGWGEDGLVRHVGQHINDSDKGKRDVDGPGQVGVGLLQLLCHEVKVIPPCIAENSLVKRHSNLPWIRG